MLKKILLSSAFLFLANASLQAMSANYALDTAHSEVEFKVRHLMISNVKGLFKEFKGVGAGTFSKDQAAIDSIHMEINPASIFTNNTDRDDHLKGKDFFDVATYKTMTFDSTKVEYKGKFPSKIHGTLTMHGVSKPVTLDVEWGGYMVDDKKVEKVAFEASGKLSRKDFGLTYNKVLETGGLAISDEVQFTVRVEANSAPKTAAK